MSDVKTPPHGLPVIVMKARQAVPGADHHPLAGPPVDLVDDGGAWRLVFEVPGAVAERLSLSVHGRVVILRGDRRPTEGERGRFLRVERVAGPFERALELPGDPDPETTSASYADGLLTVLVPKRTRARSRSIPIGRDERTGGGGR
ncbi:MAG: Hsp20/alpha crystallin family protein [Acidobacteria bacterium]|nr:MAG: Hsp20/alpha crystallin family protein [Acidobacteriota bacterium]MCE7958398.1 Hsp20/alpha crystallin family protein [Acidobacteria bacterium ACB2]